MFKVVSHHIEHRFKFEYSTVATCSHSTIWCRPHAVPHTDWLHMHSMVGWGLWYCMRITNGICTGLVIVMGIWHVYMSMCMHTCICEWALLLTVAWVCCMNICACARLCIGNRVCMQGRADAAGGGLIQPVTRGGGTGLAIVMCIW